MKQTLIGVWLMLVLLVCFGTVQAQQTGTTAPPQPYQFLLLGHQLDPQKSEDAKKLEAFATYLKDNFGKTGKALYIHEAKAYACYDKEANSVFLAQVKQQITSRFSYISIKEISEKEFIAKYPAMWQIVENQGKPVFNESAGVRTANPSTDKPATQPTR